MHKDISKDKERVLTKSQLRNKILLRLTSQKEEGRNRKSRIIAKKLFNSGVFKKAKIVMFYISFDGEVDTKKMIRDAQKLGKIVTVPVCRSNRLITPCLLSSKARLKKGPYGIPQPLLKSFISPESLDLVIVPAVAFDKQGNRLGRGKGYYDYFLKKLPKDIISVGLAFDFQILSFIPATAHDVGVNRVIFA